MIYAAGGQTFEATLTGAPTGLVGTLGVQITDGQGGVTLARTTAGIVEFPVGSGVYTASLTAPATLGSYVLVWDDGAGAFTGEDLAVTASAPLPPAPGLETLSPQALCSVADAAAYIDSADPVTHADLLTRLINAASSAIRQRAQREFKAANPAAHQRLFDVAPARLREVPIGDMRAVPTAVAVQNTAGVATALELTDVIALPLSRPSSEPISRLRLRSAVALTDSDTLAVTGLWGFPAVPEDVRQACVVQVREWFVADLSRYGEAFEDAGVVPDIPVRALSRHAWDVASGYRQVAFA